MKANELRIGNYFIDVLGNYCQAGSIQQVKSISSTGVNQWQDMGASGECKFKDMLPVPIIEERLLKFGFKLDFTSDDYKDYKKEGFAQLADYGGQCIRVKRKDYNDDGFKLYTHLECGYYSNEIDVEYVHLLQNLYSVLTKKEL